MAERVGFEPTRGVIPYALSRRACSAAPAPLRDHELGPQPTMSLRVSELSELAERVGFEPTRTCALLLFESSTFNRSDTSPGQS